MNNKYVRWFAALTLLGLLLVACKIGIGKTVKISIVYGSEKQEWLEPLVSQFNAQKVKTESGATIVVEATPIGSIESAEAIIAGTLKPTEPGLLDLHSHCERRVATG